MRVRLYSIYHKTHQVYTEKEILALAAKAGMASGSIPDVHQSLVDDGLVEKEKIGGSNYFWSFRSKKDYVAQKTHQATLDAIQDLKTKVEEASAQLADAKRGREDDCDDDELPQLLQGAQAGGGKARRAIKLQRVADLARRKIVLEAELEALKENDPSALADLEKELQLVTQAAHRWTDNIFECKSYLVKKRGIDKKQANKMLGITDNFDCKCSCVVCVGAPVTKSSCWGFRLLSLCSFFFRSHQLTLLFNRLLVHGMMILLPTTTRQQSPDPEDK